jgi:succinoglycan biosynthesis transport protein ExoP
MGLQGDSQPLLPNYNGKQLSQLSYGRGDPAYTVTSLGEPEEDKLDIRHLLAVVRRRLIVISGVAIAVTSGLVTKILSQVPNYEGKFQLLVGPVTGEDTFDQLNQTLSKNAGLSTPTVDYETQIKVLWSPQVMSPIVEQIRSRYPDINYDELVSKLVITRLGETKILEVRYQDSNPEKIKFILEQVAQGYVKYSFTEQQTGVRQGIQFVDDQLPKLQIRVDKLQEKLQRFRQQYNLIDPETQGKELTTRVSAIAQQRQETQTKLGETQSQYATLQKQLGLSPNEAIAAAALSEAPRYQQLLNQLQEVETKIAAESARFTEESPTILALREQQQNLLPLLRQEATAVLGTNTPGFSTNSQAIASPNSIRLSLTQKLVETINELRVLQVRSDAIAQTENVMGQQLKQLAVVARQYTDLQRELQVATESLNRFLGVREALQIESAQKTLPWQLISAPKQPQAPISPNMPRSLLLGVIAGLLAGAGAAFLTEKLDNVFHSPDDLKDSTGVALLGTIPFQKELKETRGKRRAATEANQKSQASTFFGRVQRYNAIPFLEAFRTLHANLHFLSPDHPIRSLVISSAVPADGKSTVTTNLAQAAAAMGQRVLLVDADLRRPQVHRLTDLPNVWGLSNVISSDMNVEDVIQRSPLEDNLFVLTAGQIPPDPTRLLSSKKMQSLIERFESAFDLVIFDTPPLLGLADARLLAAYVDAMVLVVGLGQTNRSVLTQVLDALKTSHAPLLGIVANGVKGYTTSSYDYYHRYYTTAPREQPQNEDALDLR